MKISRHKGLEERFRMENSAGNFVIQKLSPSLSEIHPKSGMI